MRILSVASTLPFPPNDGTRIRTWNLLSRLALEEEVTVVTWLTPGMDRALLGAVRDSVHEVIVPSFSPKGATLPSRLMRRVRAMNQMIPPYVLERLERAEPPDGIKGKFDLAIAEDDSALFLMPELDCPVVIHRHNIFGDTIEGLIASKSLGAARCLKWKSELPLWHRYDRELSLAADLSIVTTEGARSSLAERVPEAQIEIVPNGVEIPPRLVTPASHPVAAFIGTMSYEPNADSMVRFVGDVWQEVRRRVPGATLKIIGRDPGRAVRALAGPGVEVVGEVTDMVAACQGVRVGVVPLNAGSGIKNKTLELMAMGRAVVASREGAEGIKGGTENGLYRVLGRDSMIDSLCSLLSDPLKAERKGLAAREFARAFSWDSSATAYLDMLRTVAGARKGRNPDMVLSVRKSAGYAA